MLKGLEEGLHQASKQASRQKSNTRVHTHGRESVTRLDSCRHSLPCESRTRLAGVRPECAGRSLSLRVCAVLAWTQTTRSKTCPSNSLHDPGDV